MPLLAFIPGNHQSARLPLHFHCTPDLLRYGRPREAANRSVTERPTALDVSCSAAYARPCASRIVLSLRVSEKLPPPIPLHPCHSRSLRFAWVTSYFPFFSLSFSNLFSFYLYVPFLESISIFFVLYLSMSLRVYS